MECETSTGPVAATGSVESTQERGQTMVIGSYDFSNPPDSGLDAWGAAHRGRGPQRLPVASPDGDGSAPWVCWIGVVRTQPFGWVLPLARRTHRTS